MYAVYYLSHVSTFNPVSSKRDAKLVFFKKRISDLLLFLFFFLIQILIYASLFIQREEREIERDKTRRDSKITEEKRGRRNILLSRQIWNQQESFRASRTDFALSNIYVSFYLQKHNKGDHYTENIYTQP